MLGRRHVPRLESTVRAAAHCTRLRPLLASQCSHLRHSSTSAPERIAVLGGGIAGLTSAFFASRAFPSSNITVYESGENIGGWLRSSRVPVPGGDVLFEAGPRTLRSATATTHLIQELGLTDDLLFTLPSEPGAQNRFIYYPDRLNRLPSNAPGIADLLPLWRSGILDGALNMIVEARQPQRPAIVQDESVGDFIARRVDGRLANNIVSAVFHGIYAGDIWQLSAKTLLSLGWQLEGRYGTALGGFLKLQHESTTGGTCILAHPYDVEAARAMNDELDLHPGLVKHMQDASMFTWKNGLQTLVTALKDAMAKTGNIDIQLNSPVSSYKLTDTKQVAVTTDTATTTHDTVISSLRDPALTPHVTVMTVNLFYTNPSLLPVSGFGYLIPQSIPFEQNPERALGVIFDNSAVHGQDTAPGTKLTVMLGGHWWDGYTGFPTEEEGLEMAQAVVRRHLGIKDEPVASRVNLSKDCIPQFTLGYEERVRARGWRLQEEFKGRVRLVGAQVNGVGVNDCINGAWNLVRGLRGDGWKGNSVGLERAMDQRPWVSVEAGALRYGK